MSDSSSRQLFLAEREIRRLRNRLNESCPRRLKQARKERGEAINERNIANADNKRLREEIAALRETSE